MSNGKETAVIASRGKKSGGEAGRPAGPCVMVIFGIGGDLTKRKLFPALYNLAKDDLLPKEFAIVGTGRGESSTPEFQKKIAQEVREFATSDVEPALVDWLTERLYYHVGNFQDPAAYKSLAALLANVDKDHSTGGNYFYYLATAPEFFGEITRQLGAAGLTQQAENRWRRVIYEKPFGDGLASAHALNCEIEEVLQENQIYRIDHYLGKETVQNILAFRFGNGIFEPVWNRRYVNHVQITAAESIGVEGRGGYYQEAGALRDMIQNHLLQVMATVAMEPPAVFEPNPMRDERAKLLRSVKIMKPDEVHIHSVAGQYRGFREEQGVDPNSQTNTFAAATFFVDNWRWAGVPFYIRSGKKMPKRTTDIAIQFNSAPHTLFSSEDGRPPRPNLLILRIQPEEGISLRFLSKYPGAGMRLRPVSMDFNYGSSFGERSPSPNETLLLDVMVGDATLYTRQDMVEASWKAVTPILDAWSSQKSDLPCYPAGTWGPKESDEMLARNGHKWRNG